MCRSKDWGAHASHPSCASNPNQLPIHRSGGLWRACYTQGETPRWEKYARALPGVRSMNKAGQSYDAPNGLVENYGEIIGRAVHFTASGAFTEVAPCMRSIHWKNAPSRPERTAAHRPTLRWTGPHAAPKTSTSRSHRAASSYLVSRSSAPPSRARVRRACLDYSRQTESQQQGRDARPCTPQVRYVCCTRTTTSASSRTARTRPTDGSPRGSWSCRCAMNSSRDARPDDGADAGVDSVSGF